MGHHFRDQQSFVQNDLSRRTILKGLLGGAAAGLPVATEAATPTDSELLEACITQLRAILERMQPDVSEVRHHLDLRQDGSYRLIIQGDVAFQSYQGDGIYLVSTDGWPWEYLVREEPVIPSSAPHLGWSRYYGRARAADGGWDDFERAIPPNFIRKLTGDAS